MVAVRSFWLAQPGLSGSVSVNHFFAVDHVVSSEYADLVLSLRTIGRALYVLAKRQKDAA
jgi:hypothetical protein